MIRSETRPEGYRPAAINPLRGEFAVPVGGDLCRFDTRLSTIAAIEAACGDRPIVTVLNGIIAERRARDVIPLLAAALDAADPPDPEAAARAGRASVGEAEAFVLALVFALGFSVGRTGEGGTTPPLPDAASGSSGAPSRSAA